MDPDFFSQTPIQNALCSNLEVEDLVQLLKVLNIASVDCSITIFDPIDSKTIVLPGMNPTIFSAYRLIKKYGLDVALKKSTTGETDEITCKTTTYPLAVTAMLLKLGADPRAKDKWGTPIYAYAFAIGNDDAYNLMMKALREEQNKE